MTKSRNQRPKPMIHFVSVDSRGRLPSDVSCYKEQSCSIKDFDENIKYNSNYTCVTSQVASLCGLELNVYFDENPYGNHLHFGSNFDDLTDIYYGGEDDDHHTSYEVHRHYPHKEQLLASKDSPSPLGRINGIATLLTFNPYTGDYNHLIRGEAYVVLKEETSHLCARQVCSLQQFIQEQKLEYDDGYSHDEAKMELLTKAYEHMIAGTFIKMNPHAIKSKASEDLHHQKIIHEDQKVFQILSSENNNNYNEETMKAMLDKTSPNKNRNQNKTNDDTTTIWNPFVCHA